jgi:SAM-dependent methyltransferase
MTDKREWQEGVGKAWASSWKLTDRSFTSLTEQFLDTLSSLPGTRVVDIGCGAGELSLALARQRHDAEVIGVDVSADLIAAARERAGDNPRLRFIEADAATWQGDGFQPDLYVSRHGVMFFDDPVAAFGNLHDSASADAELVFSCFRNASENPWAAGMARVLELPPAGGSTAPGPFAFADPQHVEDILSAAGWQGIAFEPVDFAYVAGVGDDPVADALAFFRRIGPAAPVLRALDGAARDAAEARLAEWLEGHRSGNLIAFGAAAWIVTACHD